MPAASTAARNPRFEADTIHPTSCQVALGFDGRVLFPAISSVMVLGIGLSDRLRGRDRGRGRAGNDANVSESRLREQTHPLKEPSWLYLLLSSMRSSRSSGIPSPKTRPSICTRRR